MNTDEPWQALACCMEIAKASRSPDPAAYISHFPVHQVGAQQICVARVAEPGENGQGRKLRAGQKHPGLLHCIYYTMWPGFLKNGSAAYRHLGLRTPVICCCMQPLMSQYSQVLCFLWLEQSLSGRSLSAARRVSARPVLPSPAMGSGLEVSPTPAGWDVVWCMAAPARLKCSGLCRGFGGLCSAPVRRLKPSNSAGTEDGRSGPLKEGRGTELICPPHSVTWLSPCALSLLSPRRAHALSGANAVAQVLLSSLKASVLPGRREEPGSCSR